MKSMENPAYKLEIGGKSVLLDYKKFLLLKCIGERGSIVKASQKTGIPYRTALKYIEIIEEQLERRIVATQRGGKGGGGGSQLTDIGKMVLREYSKFESIFKKHADVNELEGRVLNMDKENRVMNVNLNEIKIMIPIMEDLKVGDKVLLLISPEEIFIMLEPQESSVRNVFEGKVMEMGFKNDMVRLKVSLDDEVSLSADITEYSREKLDLNLGKKVFIGFKAASVPVIKI
ncbi:MAG TPA: TOBE domain-containing protein [Methanobacterium sp.]